MQLYIIDNLQLPAYSNILYVLTTYISCVLGRVTQIVKAFNADWKRAIEVLNQDTMRSFTNFKNGTQIQQVRTVHYSVSVRLCLIELIGKLVSI